MWYITVELCLMALVDLVVTGNIPLLNEALKESFTVSQF